MDVQSYNSLWTYHPFDTITIDEMLVSVMRQPRIFTREDIVEINCHGEFVREAGGIA